VIDLFGKVSPLGDCAARRTAAAAGNPGAAIHGIIAADNTNANTSAGVIITGLVSHTKAGFTRVGA
jgi:hypothetical protein